MTALLIVAAVLILILLAYWVADIFRRPWTLKVYLKNGKTITSHYNEVNKNRAGNLSWKTGKGFHKALFSLEGEDVSASVIKNRLRFLMFWGNLIP